MAKTFTAKELAEMSVLDLRKEYSDRSELASTILPMVTAANKRLKRLQQEKEKHPEFKSPALEYHTDKNNNVDRFSVENKSEAELLNTFKEVKTFMNASTSTVSGTKKYRKEQLQRLENILSESATQEKVKQFGVSSEEVAEYNLALKRYMDEMNDYKQGKIKKKPRKPRKPKWKQTVKLTKEQASKFWKVSDKLQELAKTDSKFQFGALASETIVETLSKNRSLVDLVRVDEDGNLDLTDLEKLAEKAMDDYENEQLEKMEVFAVLEDEEELPFT